jgi:hypothetical protein
LHVWFHGKTTNMKAPGRGRGFWSAECGVRN